MENEEFSPELETKKSIWTTVTPLSKYLALAMFIVLPVFGGWIGYTYAPEKVVEVEKIVIVESSNSDEEDVQAFSDPVIESGVFTSNIANVKFDIPDEWKVLQTPPETLPAGVVDPAFILFSNEAYNCRIAGVNFDRSAAEYKQTSHATRVMSPTFQWDGNWFVNTDLYSTPVEYQRGHQFLPNEIRVSYNLRTVDFVLWNEKNAPVSDNCDTALNELLETVEYYFAGVDLSKDDAGLINIHREWDQQPGKDNSNIILTNDSNESFSVMSIPSQFGHGDDVYVWDNSLIGKYQEEIEPQSYKFVGSILQIDPFTETVTKLVDLSDQGKIIQSLYLYNQKVYYLVANNDLLLCGDRGSEKCLAELYEYSFENGETTLIAKNFAATKILGYDDSADTFYVSYGYGDAGCVTSTITSIITGIPTELQRYGGCVNEENELGYVEYQNKMSEIDSKIVTYSVSEAIRIQNGQLLQPEGENFDSYSRFIFVE